MTLCRIGSVSFSAQTITGISASSEFTFPKIARIGNHPLYQNLGKYQETITITGEEVKKKIGFLDALENIAKRKSSTRFTTVNQSFRVKITSVQRDKNTFIKDVHLMQRFTIVLKRDYGWNLF